MRKTSQRERRYPGGRPCLGTAAALASSLAYVESLRSVRLPFWLPLAATDWACVLLVTAAYAVLLLMAGAVAGFVCKPLFGNRTRSGVALLAIVAAYAVLWLLLHGSFDAKSTTYDLAAAALLIGYLGLSMLARWRTTLTWAASGVLWSTLVCTGIVVLQVTSSACLLVSETRMWLAPAVSLVSLGAMALAALTAVMFRRPPLRPAFYAACVAVAMVLAGSTAAGHRDLGSGDSPEEGSPSILLVTADAFRAGMSSVYGGPAPTPALEGMARDGILFRRSYSLAPWTAPSMRGMFSSQYPASLTQGGTREQWDEEEWNYYFDSPDPTLAERLRDAGYVTGAFSGHPMFADKNRTGMLRGFDYAAWFPYTSPAEVGPLKHTPYFASLFRPLLRGPFMRRPMNTSRFLNHYAKRFLSQTNGRPFFIWMHYMDPHDPYDPPARYRRQEGPWPLFCPTDPLWDSPQFENGVIEVEPQDRGYVQRLYEGEVSYVDECFGQMVQAIEDVGRTGSTVVCFTADHGEAFWEHGHLGHGLSVHDTQVRVPLLFRGPGIAKGTLDGPVSGIDIMPTLADLAGVDPGASWRGRSLAPSLKRCEEPGSVPCFTQATRKWIWPDTLHMVVSGGFKLIWHSSDGTRELYDVTQDPRELNNLAASRSELADEMHGLLQTWLGSFKSQMGGVESSPDQRNEMRERLDSVGYLK